MKRRALLIGYSGYDLSNGYLDGVSKDLDNYRNFLMSYNGGAWDATEIITIQDQNVFYINYMIQQIKDERNDMVFSVFSGHGDFNIKNDCREIEISKDDIISEKELWNLAPQQILILDSCSDIPEEFLLEKSNFTAGLANLHISRGEVREIYENQCKNCPPQQIYLYASSMGTSAKDTRNGGKYSYALLQLLTYQHNYIDIVQAHDNVSKDLENRGQYPDKSVSRVHPFLPGSLGIGA